MTVAVYVNDKNDVATMIPWGIRFASVENTDLLIVVPKRSKSKTDWSELTADSISKESLIHQAIFAALGDLDEQKFVLGSLDSTEREKGPSQIRVVTRELVAAHPNSALVKKVEEYDISLLLINADELLHPTYDHKEDSIDIFFDSPCQTMVIRGKPIPENKDLRILVGAQKEGAENEVAIKLAFELIQVENGRVTFLYVRPDDDEVAEQVGLVSANRLINQLYSQRHNIDCRVSLADKLTTGIQNQKDLDSFDLVIVGAKSSAYGSKLFKAWEKNESTSKVPLAIVKDRVPLTTRFWSRTTRGVRSIVPQMDRDLRIKLVDRLNSNSKWDFDFIALISLSTLIAALGLVRNSGAVVIGAMLVAPLMTPLVGIGFALVQGNIKLIRQSLRSLTLGFALAFVIGVAVGTLVHLMGFDGLKTIDTIPAEMLSRGHPNFLDLVVALVSGIAAAYAMGRPHLVSALPGVAIAAALVPPIATSGMALSLFAIQLSIGSLLLFLTNIVAITLGCAIVFWAVGIDSRVNQKSKLGDDRKARQWPRYVFLAFVILSIILAAAMHYMEI